MILFSSKYRSNQLEIMDDFQLRGDEMRALLTDLKRVNQWLGGNSITINGLKKLLKNHSNRKSIVILDVGCGDGAILRECAKWAIKKNIDVKLIGIDANPYILQEAINRSEEIKNTTFKVFDVFSRNEELPEYDIALCTLFLHHFKEAQIVELLQLFSRKAKLGVVINDLERNRWAFWLFKLFSSVFLKTTLAKHDGLISVARGFKRKELLLLSEKISGSHFIKQKWVFRYQWIIKKDTKPFSTQNT